MVAGKRVLVVDEVDDTRTTLQCERAVPTSSRTHDCCLHIPYTAQSAERQAAHDQQNKMKVRTGDADCVEELMKGPIKPAAVAVAVVHNKEKPKRGALPAGVQYMVADTVADSWLCYPWDAAKYGKDVVEQHTVSGQWLRFMCQQAFRVLFPCAVFRILFWVSAWQLAAMCSGESLRPEEQALNLRTELRNSWQQVGTLETQLATSNCCVLALLPAVVLAAVVGRWTASR